MDFGLFLPQPPFGLAWGLAPILWLSHNSARFVLLSSLVGATLGGIVIASFLEDRAGKRTKTAVTALLVILAIVYPFGPPSLGAKITWLLRPYPRYIDWPEMKTNARVIRDNGLEDRLVSGTHMYYIADALAIWSDVRAAPEGGDEIAADLDPAKHIGMDQRVYIIPIAPADSALAEWNGQGWIHVHGGGDWSAVITFAKRPSIDEALRNRNRTWAREATWIAAYCEHNTLGNIVKLYLDRGEIPRRRAARGECRARVSRMAVALLLLSHAFETEDSGKTVTTRYAANALASLAAVLGEEAMFDFRSAAWHEQLKTHMAALASAARVDNDDKIEALFLEILAHLSQGHRGNLFGLYDRENWEG